MIKRFYVHNLFGMFKNEINFREEKITVIIGTNGCGKTTMLHMLDAIFSQNHSQLFEYKFDYIEVDFGEHVLKIELIDDYVDEEKITVKSLKYYIDSVALDKLHKENSKMYSSSFWVREIPFLRRRPGNLFWDDRSGEVLTLSEVISEYFETLNDDVKREIFTIPEEVYNLVNKLKIELISTERLKRVYRDYEYGRGEVVQKFAVEECAKELKNNLKNKLSEYANISQKLDEQFPFKTLEAIKQHQRFSVIELKNRVQEIDELRKKHVVAGVIEENNDKFLGMKENLDGIDDSTAAVLTVYYQDMKEKLESLNDISDRIILFKDVMTNKFNERKEISIDRTDGILIKQKNDKIELKYLSSGEQQELVLLYNLIFKGKKESLILIDEPEISLNVTWQREFLDDMKNIVDMNGFSLLIATHSPQVINNNWELVETLGESE